MVLKDVCTGCKAQLEPQEKDRYNGYCRGCVDDADFYLFGELGPMSERKNEEDKDD